MRPGAAGFVFPGVTLTQNLALARRNNLRLLVCEARAFSHYLHSSITIVVEPFATSRNMNDSLVPISVMLTSYGSLPICLAVPIALPHNT